MRLIMLCLLIGINSACLAQTAPEKPAIVYGAIKKEALMNPPYDKWFRVNYDSYHPDSLAMDTLSKQSLKGITMEIFFGSWCGDSKRELPRFYRIIDQLPGLQKHVKLIGVGAGDSLYKQSPAHEEAGKNIIRVPVFIIYRDGKEVNRITEFPVVSLERDLLAILKGVKYKPNWSN